MAHANGNSPAIPGFMAAAFAAIIADAFICICTCDAGGGTLAVEIGAETEPETDPETDPETEKGLPAVLVDGLFCFSPAEGVFLNFSLPSERASLLAASSSVFADSSGSEFVGVHEDVSAGGGVCEEDWEPDKDFCPPRR